MQKFIKKKFLEYNRDFTSIVNPFILVLIATISLGFSKKLMILIFVLILNEFIGAIIKHFFHKDRPNKQKHSGFFDRIDAGSFPSIHSSRAMLVFLTLAMNSVNELKIIFLLLIPLVGYTRVKLKKHFLIDVLGGYFLGFLLYIIF